MELIIKPTSKCNFNCKFCSANLLTIKHNNHLSDNLKNVLDILKPNDLIITGGDPLMMNPSYYDELLSYGNWNISLTTNLKDFYFHPDKWVSLFKNPRVGICTSFQYGEDRLWDKNTVYDENMFKKVCQLFFDKIGYVPSFIAVINEKNEHRAIDHFYLAKELNNKCKINPVMAMGLSKESYPKYKMIDIWLKIKELGLEPYWDNDVQFKKGGCGFNTNLLCGSTIRAFYEDINGNVHYSDCEECLVYNDREIPLDTTQPLIHKIPLNINDYINNKCLTCELCQFCNGCKIARSIAKDDNKYCQEMLKRKQKILESGWKI